eukprot:scaffold486_cov148-Skeletonema_dohrnii-CCMP3373.AAC.6
MSFQDVGRGGRSTTRPPQRRGPQQGYSTGGAFSSAAAGNGRSPPPTNTTANSSYDHISDSILQYQKNVALLERMSLKLHTPEETPVLQTQYTLQIDVITQLGQRIETQLSAADKRLATMSRGEAAGCRTTHVKLNRDYRMVEQKYKNVMLDVRKRKGLAEARRRERRMEEERRVLETNGSRGSHGVDLNGGGSGVGGGDLSEEGVRWQMQIQEDRINEEIMREREEEIRNIHKGMHTVNEIYKDLAHLVDNQQEGVDQIENQMENAKDNTASGLKHIEKANEASSSQCVIS